MSEINTPEATSSAPQILVIFIIRTARPLWASRPHSVLATTSLDALAVALVLALTPLGGFVGFAALALPILAAITSIRLADLAAAEVPKRFARTSKPHAPVALLAHALSRMPQRPSISSTQANARQHNVLERRPSPGQTFATRGGLSRSAPPLAQ